RLVQAHGRSAIGVLETGIHERDGAMVVAGPGVRILLAIADADFAGRALFPKQGPGADRGARGQRGGEGDTAAFVVAGIVLRWRTGAAAGQHCQHGRGDGWLSEAWCHSGSSSVTSTASASTKSPA